jgi:hypothetical protein
VKKVARKAVKKGAKKGAKKVWQRALHLKISTVRPIARWRPG